LNHTNWIGKRLWYGYCDISKQMLMSLSSSFHHLQRWPRFRKIKELIDINSLTILRIETIYKNAEIKHVNIETLHVAKYHSWIFYILWNKQTEIYGFRTTETGDIIVVTKISISRTAYSYYCNYYYNVPDDHNKHNVSRAYYNEKSWHS
jgi:hypothetical protein